MLKHTPRDLQQGYEEIADGAVGFRCTNGGQCDDFEEAFDRIEVRSADSDNLATLFGIIAPYFDWYDVIESDEKDESEKKLTRIREILNDVA